MRDPEDEFLPGITYAMIHAALEAETPAEKREAAISWAYGNAALSNPDVTREMVEAAYDRIHGPKEPT